MEAVRDRNRDVAMDPLQLQSWRNDVRS
jgi:hypothetical protein